MEDTLISFETAKLAKEKGFYLEYPEYYYDKDEDTSIYDICRVEYSPCGPNYPLSELYKTSKEDWYICSTQSLLQCWLREKHNIIIEILMFENTPNYKYRIWVNPQKGKNCSNVRSEKVYECYEQALEEALLQGLNLIKNE